MSETVADHEKAEGTKLLSWSASSPLEGQSKTEFNSDYEDFFLEMDDKIMHPISSSIVESSSNTLETHLWRMECIWVSSLMYTDSVMNDSFVPIG